MWRARAWEFLRLYVMVGGLVFWGGRLTVSGQTNDTNPANSFKQFTFPDFYPPPHQDHYRTKTTGQDARLMSNGNVLLTTLKILTFPETSTNADLTIEADSCVFDRSTGTASSPGPVKINSGNGNLHIEGEGFLWRTIGTNSVLTISNKVHTTIKKDYLSQAAGGGATNAAQKPSSQTIEIYSDQFRFDRQTDLITYTGNVRAEDPQIQLLCEVMEAQRSTKGTIDRIVADRNVMIIDKASGGQTTGDHAVYTSQEGKQAVELTGNPHWHDAAKDATAKVFFFDRFNNTLYLRGEAYLKVPRNAIGQPGILSPSNPATKAPTSGTNEFVEIYSEDMRFQLSPTNGSAQSVVAEKNVVIVDAQRNGRATGDRAEYHEADGLLTITGNALWQSDERKARGGNLVFDQNRKTFYARTNAYLRIPAAAFGRTMPAAGSSTNSSAKTNMFVEILCDHYEYENDTLTFHDQAHAAFLEGDVIHGILDSAVIRATFRSNQLDNIKAEGDVYGRLLPIPNAAGNMVEKELKSETLTVQLGTNGFLEYILADKNVTAIQTDTIKGRTEPVRQTLNSETMTAKFLATTNQLERLVADKNVVITREDMVARGTQAVFTAANNVAVLTGDPVVTMPMGTMTGERMTYDRTRNKLLVKKDRGGFNVGTNKFLDKLKPGKPAK